MKDLTRAQRVALAVQAGEDFQSVLRLSDQKLDILLKVSPEVNRILKEVYGDRKNQ